MNNLSSLQGVLSRIEPPVKKIFTPDTEPDVIVDIGGERFVVGQDERLSGIKVEYNVRGGGLCTLEWAYYQAARVGAPVTVYIGADVFWAGTVLNGLDTAWEAQPLQGIFDQIYYWSVDYVKEPYAGPVSELVQKIFRYAVEQNSALKIGRIVASDMRVEVEINSRTLKEILDDCASVFENEGTIYGITNTYEMFFDNIPRTDEVLINEDGYGGELVHSMESDNIATVYSVFKNREVPVIDAEGNEDFIYPVEFIGKVGIGTDPVSKQYYPPTANYFVYGHKEERWELDAPDMLNSKALADAYNHLRRLRPTVTIRVPQYRYGKNSIPVGSSMRIYSKSAYNISMTIPIARESVAIGQHSGALAVVQETAVNEAWTEGSGGAARISDLREWIEQAGLVQKIIEISIGYVARYDGVITLKSGGKTWVNSCSNSPLIHFFTVRCEGGFDKFDVEIITRGGVDLVSMYALGDYGQAMYRGYLRAVELKSSLKGNFYELEIKSYGSQPVLTMERLQQKIRSVETISLRG